MTINKIPQTGFSNDDMVVNTFTATAGQTAFTLTKKVSLNSVLVHVNDVIQQPTADYTINASPNNNILTFGSGCAVGDDVRVRILSENPLGVATGGGSGITLAQARSGISVTTGSASGGGALAYDNGTGVLTFNPSTNSGGGGSGIALTDISVGTEGSALGNGQMSYNNSTGVFTYTPPTLAGLSGSINDLSDVSTSGVSSGQVLKYNGSSWAAAADTSGIALTDISTSSASASGGGSLAYNNSNGVFTYTPPLLSGVYATVASVPYVSLPDDQEFGVTAGSSVYTFTGAATGNNPTLTLEKGKTYRFDVNASGHPFQIRVSNGGSNYTNGVENAGTESGSVYFTVPDGAPATLVYQCTNHAAMVGTINVIDKIVPGHIIQTTSMVAVNNTQVVGSNSSSNTLIGNGIICAITPLVASSRIRTCLSYSLFCATGTATNIFMGRSVAGGTYNYVNSGNIQNRFEGEWSNAILDIIDTPSYTLGQAISYQPYWYTSNTSSNMYFGVGGGAITFYLQEIAS